MCDRPAIPADHFVAPFPNEQAARAANGGALPPDLSLIVQAREGGADYIHAFLIGFEDPPEDAQLMPGMNWNRYFPGHPVGMPNILSDGGVEFADGPERSEARRGGTEGGSTEKTWCGPNHEKKKQLTKK